MLRGTTLASVQSPVSRSSDSRLGTGSAAALSIAVNERHAVPDTDLLADHPSDHLLHDDDDGQAQPSIWPNTNRTTRHFGGSIQLVLAGKLRES